MSKPVLIDTDAGVDDALAIILALRSPELSVKAITTVAGNAEVEKCTLNVLRLVDLVSSREQIAVAQGAGKPLKQKLLTAPEVHGEDGLGNTRSLWKSLRQRRSSLSAVETIIAFCKQYGKKGTIIALGPLTNIAFALRKNHRAMRQVGSVVSMGGALRVPGNTGPVAEFNYYVDPDAADFVLNSGLTITVVPLDLTEQIVMMRSELEHRARRRASPVARAIMRFTKFYMQYHRNVEGFYGGYLHDPIAVAVAIAKDLVQTRSLHVNIETRGAYTRGMTVAGFRKKPSNSESTVKVALKINRERFLRLFHERIWK